MTPVNSRITFSGVPPLPRIKGYGKMKKNPEENQPCQNQKRQPQICQKQNEKA